MNRAGVTRFSGLILLLELIILFLSIPVCVVSSTQMIKARKSQVYYEKLALETQNVDHRISFLSTATANRAVVKDRAEKTALRGAAICFVLFLLWFKKY